MLFRNVMNCGLFGINLKSAQVSNGCNFPLKLPGGEKVTERRAFCVELIQLQKRFKIEHRV